MGLPKKWYERHTWDFLEYDIAKEDVEYEQEIGQRSTISWICGYGDCLLR